MGSLVSVFSNRLYQPKSFIFDGQFLMKTHEASLNLRWYCSISVDMICDSLVSSLLQSAKILPLVW